VRRIGRERVSEGRVGERGIGRGRLRERGRVSEK